MILTASDRDRLRVAFQARIGSLSLPASTTIDDLCANLVLAVPALLDAIDGAEEVIIERGHDVAHAEQRIAILTAQLEADPCP